VTTALNERSRSGTIVEGLGLLKTLVDRTSEGEQRTLAEEMYSAWSARLDKELALNATYPLSTEIRLAFQEMRESLGDIPQEALIDWIDLVGQNVLLMTDVLPVAVTAPREEARPCGPANERFADPGAFRFSFAGIAERPLEGNNQSALALAA
jgi:hypothetical protein